MANGIELVNGLILDDPFMVASSHWTANEAAFRHIAKVSPSAITLKTTSEIYGGEGVEQRDLKRNKQRLYDSFNNNLATFTDGPKTLELWDMVTTFQMTKVAKATLPDNCKIGLSVLQGEDYSRISKSLDLSLYDYIELNFKFSFRPIEKFLEGSLTKIKTDLESFLAIFNDKPLLIKMSRETSLLIGTKKLQELLRIINVHGAGLVVANSKKCFVPPSLTRGQDTYELNGVVVGEHLFLDTYNMIHSLKRNYDFDGKFPAIAASGGVSNISQIIDIMAVGADAIQLCTIFDLMGPQVLLWFKEQFKMLCEQFGGYKDFIKSIRTDEKKWIKAADFAKEFEFSQKRVVHKALADKQNLLNIFTETIAQKAVTSSEKPKCMEHSELPKDLKFAVSLGNVSSFLISQCFIMKSGLMSFQFNSSSLMIKEFQNDDFHYDLAILPRSSLEFIQKHNIQFPTGNEPIELLTVSYSTYELVGKKGVDLSNIDTVYHFGGNSSKKALSSLLEHLRLQNFEKIKSKNKLLPLLQFWNDNSAILAKPPLSRLYGLLGKKQLHNSWSVFLETKEDLVLVASNMLLEKNRESDILATVKNNIKIEMDCLLTDTNIRAQDLMNLGFIGHCKDLLIDPT